MAKIREDNALEDIVNRSREFPSALLEHGDSIKVEEMDEHLDQGKEGAWECTNEGDVHREAADNHLYEIKLLSSWNHPEVVGTTNKKRILKYFFILKSILIGLTEIQLFDASDNLIQVPMDCVSCSNNSGQLSSMHGAASF